MRNMTIFEKQLPSLKRLQERLEPGEYKWCDREYGKLNGLISVRQSGDICQTVVLYAQK